MESSRPNICGVLNKKSLWRTRKEKHLVRAKEKLPQMLRGTTCWGKGRLYVRPKHRLRGSGIDLGDRYVVEEEPDFCKRSRRRGLPEIPGELSGSRTGIVGTFRVDGL